MSNALTGLSDALADTVSTSGVGVVRVEGRDRVPASGIIWSADGLVVTAHHVLERDENISVGMPGGESLPATLVDRYIQADLVMPPGFSGGPTVAADGNVVGLTTSALLSGISLVLPLNTVKRVVGALLAHGRILRAYIGVGSQPARLPDVLADQLGQSTGLLVASKYAGQVPVMLTAWLLAPTVQSTGAPETGEALRTWGATVGSLRA